MKYNFSVPEVSCGHCKMRIETALNALDGVTSAEVDIEKKRVQAESDLPAEDLIRAIDEAGYDAEEI